MPTSLGALAQLIVVAVTIIAVATPTLTAPLSHSEDVSFAGDAVSVGALEHAHPERVSFAEAAVAAAAASSSDNGGVALEGAVVGAATDLMFRASSNCDPAGPRDPTRDLRVNMFKMMRALYGPLAGFVDCPGSRHVNVTCAEFDIPGSVCVTCPPGTLKHGALCVETCPRGTAPSGDASNPACMACHASCSADVAADEDVCFGPAVFQCTRCATSHVVAGQNTCVDACPAGTHAVAAVAGGDAAAVCMPTAPLATPCDAETPCEVGLFCTAAGRCCLSPSDPGIGDVCMYTFGRVTGGNRVASPTPCVLQRVNATTGECAVDGERWVGQVAGSPRRAWPDLVRGDEARGIVFAQVSHALASVDDVRADYKNMRRAAERLALLRTPGFDDAFVREGCALDCVASICRQLDLELQAVVALNAWTQSFTEMTRSMATVQVQQLESVASLLVVADDRTLWVTIPGSSPGVGDYFREVGEKLAMEALTAVSPQLAFLVGAAKDLFGLARADQHLPIYAETRDLGVRLVASELKALASKNLLGVTVARQMEAFAADAGLLDRFFWAQRSLRTPQWSDTAGFARAQLVTYYASAVAALLPAKFAVCSESVTCRYRCIGSDSTCGGAWRQFCGRDSGGCRKPAAHASGSVGPTNMGMAPGGIGALFGITHTYSWFCAEGDHNSALNARFLDGPHANDFLTQYDDLGALMKAVQPFTFDNMFYGPRANVNSRRVEGMLFARNNMECTQSN